MLKLVIGMVFLATLSNTAHASIKGWFRAQVACFPQAAVDIQETSHGHGTAACFPFGALMPFDPSTDDKYRKLSPEEISQLAHNLFKASTSDPRNDYVIEERDEAVQEDVTK